MKNLFLLAAILLLAVTNQVKAQAPANDNFANRQTIGVGTVNTDTTSATVEAGEPIPGTYRTVWYSYTATSDSIVTIDNTGTNFQSNFVAVYIGNAINQLVSVNTRNSGLFSSTPYTVSFKAKAGTTFQILAGSISPNTYGNLALTILTTPFVYTGVLYGPEVPNSQNPTNDNFANRTVLSGDSLTAISYTESATVEAGEPNTGAYRTVWYSYTATSDSIVTIDNTGTNFESNFVSVYTGDAINQLVSVNSGSSGYFSSTPYTVSFEAKAGTTFQILAGSIGYNTYGLLQLTLTSLVTPPPVTYYYVSVRPSPRSKGTVSGAGTYSSGSYVVVKAKPKPGKKFKQWTENGRKVSGSKNYGFTVTYARNLVAVFK